MKLERINHVVVSDEFVYLEVTGEDVKLSIRFSGKWHELNNDIKFVELAHIAESLKEALEKVVEDLTP